MKKQVMSGVLAVASAVSNLCGAVQPAAAASKAREKGWKAATWASGAGTAVALGKGKGTWALVGAGATLLSYSQWKREVDKRHQDHSYAAYKRYRSSWYAAHKTRKK